MDEGVVDQMSHVLERLPVVFTDAQKKRKAKKRFAVELDVFTNLLPGARREAFLTSCRGWTGRNASLTTAPERSSKPAAPEEERHFQRHKSVSFSQNTYVHVDELTPDPSPTQPSDSEPRVRTLNVN